MLLFSKKRTPFFISLFLTTLFLRLPSLFIKIMDVDESIFADVAHSMLTGGRIYHDALDNKPPLIFLFYQLFFTLFGAYNMIALHAVTILWVFLTALVLYNLGKNYDDEKTGMVAAFFYVIFSTTYYPKFIATNINTLMALPLCLSIWFILKSETQRKYLYSLLAGLLVSAAFLLRYQGGIQIVVFFCFLLPFFNFRKKQFFTNTLKYIIFLVGFIFPIIAVTIWLQQMGTWEEFLRWSYQASFHYISASSQLNFFLKNFFLKLGSYILFSIPAWYLAGRFLARDFSFKNSFHVLTTLWFALSFAAICVGGRFYGHYVLQALPPLCLMAAMATKYFLINKDAKIIIKKTGWIFVVPALFFWGIRLTPSTTEKLFPDDGLPQQKEIGLWIKSQSHSNDTLFVWGFAPAIYYYAEIQSASRFFWSDYLTDRSPLTNQSLTLTQSDRDSTISKKAWECLWEDFNKNPPTYFIDTSLSAIHNYRYLTIDKYPELLAYVQKNYEMIKQLEGSTIYRRK